MWIGIDEAVRIYAQFWRARHGTAAAKVAHERAEQLHRIGDEDGHNVWNRVAEEIRDHENALHLHGPLPIKASHARRASSTR